MTLLFDFGGVLVRLDRARCVREFRALGFDVTPYLGDYRQDGIFSRLERGEISVAEFCAGIREAGGLSAQTDDEAIANAWRSFLTGIPAERLELLLKARRHYRVCLLSNTNELHWQQATQDFFRYKGLGANDFFDHIFLSFELGCEKPDPRIYHKVVETLGTPAGDILFFDDSERNCQAARECGLRATVAPPDGSWMRLFDAEGRLPPSAGLEA